jgi:Ca-activated chloride channel family protein
VPAHVIRPWEFLNYYDFRFEPAEPDEVRMHAQLSSCPQDDRLSLQVALQAEQRANDARAPLTITLVLDTSGSMGGSPIALERAAVRAIASQLRAGDVVSAVTWAEVQTPVLEGHEVTGPNDSALLALASSLDAGGGTNLHGGLVHGYALAERYYGADRINRVVLVSDGQANVGVTDETLIGEHADDEEGEAGIYLAGIGVGDGVNDTLMNVVTDAGRGTYIYLDSEAEAQRMLGARFLQAIDLAVRNVRLEVTLPYHLVLEEFYGEVASTDASLVRPQHLAPNDAMLFFQVLRACEPELLRGDDRILLRATWQTTHTREDKETVIDTTLNALAGDDADLTKGAAIAAYADALIAAASPGASGERTAILTEALQTVRAAQNADTDPDLIEIAGLLERYVSRP